MRPTFGGVHQQQIKPMSSKPPPPSSALNILNARDVNMTNRRNPNNGGIGNNSGKIDAVTWIKPESIPKMLSDMNLPHRIDHTTQKFYHEACTLYIRRVFDLAMDYASYRSSTNVEMKDVLRAIKKYSSVPPNQWNHVKLKNNSNSKKNKSRNVAMVTHKRRLNIAKKSQKIMDKNFNKNKK